jgi:hypothetical protein
MAQRNLFDVVQEIALYSLVDFDVEFTGSTGNPEFTFKTYFPFNGTDRTTGVNIVTLSPELDSMALPVSYLNDRSNEINSMLVLGQGSGEDRLFAVQETLAVNDSPWNLKEGTADYRQQPDQIGLDDIALAELQKRQAVETITFRTRQASQLQYGKNFFLGDKVNLGFDEIRLVKRLLQTHGSVKESKEEIELTWGDFTS